MTDPRPLRPMRRGLRRVVERIIGPHLDTRVERLERLVGQQSDGEPPLLQRDFNHLLHELRTIELRRMPVEGGRLLSAGCAGRWYLDWVEDCAGPLVQHIGVESYSPQPDDLPANATWVVASASDMPQIDAGSVDTVFSGQHIEHLLPDAMVGFLCEAWRCLRPDGWLVIDSPNRLVTEALGWVQPEHTIELSPSEAQRLLVLAGFSVAVVRPVWRCVDQRTGETLPLQASADDLAGLLDRAVGRMDPDEAFVWWMEARRTDRRPDRDALAAEVDRLFASHWTNRINRAAGCVGCHDPDRGWTVAAGTEGLLYRTHGFPLFVGTYTVDVEPAAADDLELRLVAADGSVLAAGPPPLTTERDEVTFAVSAEVVAETPLAESLSGLRVRVTRH